MSQTITAATASPVKTIKPPSRCRGSAYHSKEPASNISAADTRQNRYTALRSRADMAFFYREHPCSLIARPEARAIRLRSRLFSGAFPTLRQQRQKQLPRPIMSRRRSIQSGVSWSDPTHPNEATLPLEFGGCQVEKEKAVGGGAAEQLGDPNEPCPSPHCLSRWRAPDGRLGRSAVSSGCAVPAASYGIGRRSTDARRPMGRTVE
jgi:hypothetical protein